MSVTVIRVAGRDPIVSRHKVAPFVPDATGPIADRSDFDAETPEFSYLATDEGLIYFRKITEGEWSDGILFPGPAGADGEDGVDGTDGSDGADGAPGSVWRSGSGAPAGGLGIVGDWYLNTANGDVYEKTGASAYTLRDNLTGPQGEPGEAGEGGGGVTDHGALTGLSADDHTQYHTDARAATWGDARYTPIAHIDDTSDAHDASAISVADAGGDYAATDVEGVLAEIAPQLGGGSGMAVEEDGTEEGTGIDRFDFTTGLNVSVSGSQATISASASGGYTPAWLQTGAGAKYAAIGSGDPNPWAHLYTNNLATGTASTNALGGTSSARMMKFRLPVNLAVSHVYVFTSSNVINALTLAVYPVGTGATRSWQSGTIASTTVGGWNDITANTPFTLTAGVDYWIAICGVVTNTTAAFRIVTGQDQNWFGNDSSVLAGIPTVPVIGQIAVTSGAWPGTLPALSTPSSLATPPLFLLEGTAS